MTQAKPMKFRNNAWMIVGSLMAGTIVIAAATHSRSTTSDGGGDVTHLTASADAGVTLSGHLDRTAVLQGSDGRVHLELIIGAESLPDTDSPRLPTDLVVVLDRSGSMQGEKIQQARAAIHQLITQLEPEDRFGLVAFSSSSQVAIPLTHATPGTSTVWNATVEALGAGGGTFMAPALDLGLGLIEDSRQAGRSPRVMLLSDGLAAEAPDLLRRQASRAARGEYTLSTVGVGADFDESMMSSLADAGTGNYYYLRDLKQLADIFSDEFETARSTVASGLAVSLTPGDGIQVIEAAGYPLERKAGAVTFHPGTLYSGQERRVWLTLEVPTHHVVERPLGEIALAFSRDGIRRRIALDDLPRIATVQTQDDFLAGLDDERWSRAVVAEEYGNLQKKVGSYLQRGQRHEARREINAFRARTAPLQAAANSPEVARALEDAGELAVSVDAAFAHPNAPAARNQLGKELHMKSVVERRAGDRI
jgi:Ca-activated chloride channel family protein